MCQRRGGAHERTKQMLDLERTFISISASWSTKGWALRGRLPLPRRRRCLKNGEGAKKARELMDFEVRREIKKREEGHKWTQGAWANFSSKCTLLANSLYGGRCLKNEETRDIKRRKLPFSSGRKPLPKTRADPNSLLRSPFLLLTTNDITGLIEPES